MLHHRRMTLECKYYKILVTKSRFFPFFRISMLIFSPPTKYTTFNLSCVVCNRKLQFLLINSIQSRKKFDLLFLLNDILLHCVTNDSYIIAWYICNNRNISSRLSYLTRDITRLLNRFRFSFLVTQNWHASRKWWIKKLQCCVHKWRSVLEDVHVS